MKRLLCLLSILGLAGCGASLFQSRTPVPSVYLLSASGAPPGAAPAAAPAADLAVLKPRVRTGLDTDLIAVLYPDRRLDYFAAARWSGPLDEVIQDLAVQAFRTRSRLRDVHTDASAFGRAYWLEIDVADFQAEYAAGAADGAGAADSAVAPTVHVHLLARVGSSGDRRVLGLFDADRRQPAAQNRLTAIVEAYNQAVDAALGQIVDDTVATLNRSSEPR